MCAARQGHVEAIAQLGTLHRFGRGVAQNLVTAAGLHVLAAKAGDSMAMGNLCDYMKELEQLALDGSTSASVTLATIYDRGLGVGQDAAMALAWTRWARANYKPEVDEHVLAELERLEFEHVIMCTPDVELRAETLLAEMHKVTNSAYLRTQS